MRLIIGALLAFTIAAVVGLGATWVTLTRGMAFGAITIGGWSAWPKSGTPAIDPYARANIARIGALPISIGDGVAFYARADDAGRVFDGRCEVALNGLTPSARFWTLALYDLDGKLVANSLRRHGFTSQEILRKADGRFEILVSPRARPGNWLPTSGIDRYILVMRLYDTPIGVATRTRREAPMPTLTRRGCS